MDEKIAQLRKGASAWLEPLRSWIKDMETCGESAVSTSLSHKKSSAQKIFGSNLFLKNRFIVSTPTTPSDALRASRENFIKTGSVSYLSIRRELNLDLLPHCVLVSKWPEPDLKVGTQVVRLLMTSFTLNELKLVLPENGGGRTRNVKR